MKTHKAKEVVDILKKNGWRLVKIKGSHHHFKHPFTKGKVTVPYVKSSEKIKIKTLKSIFKQAGIDYREV
jgi:predicted RNA binding protein YcfA (HicA-like mRNA interferase family)